MRIPLSWLKEYISLSLGPSEIAKLLTMAGLEVDAYETVGEGLQQIVVGRVLEVSKHPNADKLTVATVSDGKEIHQVVCGAPNCRQGMKTAFAPIGAKLSEGDEVFIIKKTKIRGVESCGMLCSGKELKLSDDHEGILELPESLTEGTPLSDVYADTFFDISLTPNLNYCASIFGVARELAVLTGQSLHYPEVKVGESGEPIEDSLRVNVIDQADCPRYACRVIERMSFK